MAAAPSLEPPTCPAAGWVGTPTLSHRPSSLPRPPGQEVSSEPGERHSAVPSGVTFRRGSGEGAFWWGEVLAHLPRAQGRPVCRRTRELLMVTPRETFVGVPVPRGGCGVLTGSLWGFLNQITWEIREETRNLCSQVSPKTVVLHNSGSGPGIQCLPGEPAVPKAPQGTGTQGTLSRMPLWRSPSPARSGHSRWPH